MLETCALEGITPLMLARRLACIARCDRCWRRRKRRRAFPPGNMLTLAGSRSAVMYVALPGNNLTIFC
jgi:hypothetical protein